MAVELAHLGVRVNAVAPGSIETPMVAAMHAGEERERRLRVIPMKRYGLPKDVAQAVLFLIDESKSGFVTGEVVCVDGGFNAAGVVR